MGVEVAALGLTKSFGRQDVWRDVTLTLPAGEVSVPLGPSGTGKSVFLKCLIGLLFQDGALFGSMNLATILIVTHNIHVARTVPDNLGMLFRRELVTVYDPVPQIVPRLRPSPGLPQRRAERRRQERVQRLYAASRSAQPSELAAR